MPPSEIRKEARQSLNKKWGKAISIILAFALISFILNLIENRIKLILGDVSFIILIFNLALFIISVPLSFGLIISFIKLKRNEKISAFDFLKNGFSRFGKSWGIWGHTLIRLLLPFVCLTLSLMLVLFNVVAVLDSISSIVLSLLCVLLFLVSIVYGISRSLLYSLAYYIGYDNADLSCKDCVKESEKIMTGNRGNLFLLQLSFIGWAILSILTFGIGLILLIPYIQVSTVCFYERLTKTDSKKIDETVIN